MTSTHPVDADDLRPDPDALLARVQQQEAQARRGRLKIFFGASAGVGKTYRMLKEAQQAQAAGKRVLIGWVETHQRADTAAQLGDLPIQLYGLRLGVAQLGDGLADIRTADQSCCTSDPPFQITSTMPALNLAIVFGCVVRGSSTTPIRLKANILKPPRLRQ